MVFRVSTQVLVIVGIVLVISVAVFRLFQIRHMDYTADSGSEDNLQQIIPTQTPPFPLTIQALRDRTFAGSEIVVEQTLSQGSNYDRYRVSYLSDGLKIYALMTVPRGQKPQTGWPVVIFNHGYIPPAEYRTAERYVSYVDGFARNGYIVFRSDYRGHDQSEGVATGGYGTNDYTIDVLNGLASVKRYKDADSKRIGMWGHSMGGHITLRSMVVTKDIKAGVIWAGVVASYPELLTSWNRRSISPPPLPSGARRWRQVLIDTFGTPDANPEFWNSISSSHFLADISGPVQLHHATGDESVPYEFSQGLADKMKAVQKDVELFIYQGDDHNIAVNFGAAITRSIAFFDKYVKGD